MRSTASGWEIDALLILLDPVMSRIDTKLDTHKDAEVRMALEPLVKLAEICSPEVWRWRGWTDLVDDRPATRSRPNHARGSLDVWSSGSRPR